MPSILIVDDEPGVRSALGGVLRDEGYDVEAVDSGEACSRRWRASRTTSWCSTSGFRAWTAWQRLRACASGRSTSQVVIISGHGNIESAVRAIKMGAFDFVEKPLSLEKTVLVVRNALRQRRLEAENRALRARVDAHAHDDRRELRHGEAAGAGGDGGADQRPGAHLRRERHGQGAGGAQYPSVESPARRPVRGGQLRGDSRGADRERAVRPRARRLHRRRGRPPREVRAGPRGHDLSRRDRRHEPEDTGQGAACLAGTGDGGGGRVARASASTPVSLPPRTRICRRRSGPVGSARTSSFD